MSDVKLDQPDGNLDDKANHQPEEVRVVELHVVKLGVDRQGLVDEGDKAARIRETATCWWLGLALLLIGPEVEAAVLSPRVPPDHLGGGYVSVDPRYLTPPRAVAREARM